MQGTSNVLERVIGSLKSAPGAAFEFARDGVGSISDTISETFGASNVAKAILPPVIGDIASNFLDRRKARKEKERKARESDAEESDDDEDDAPEVGESDAEAPDLGDVVEDIDVNVEDLADAIHEGFDDTNENLDRIFDILSDQEEAQEDETKSTFELVGVNGQILSSIERVENNTRVNELDKKLSHHNQRKEMTGAARDKVSDKIGEKKKSFLRDHVGGGIISRLLGGVAESFIGSAFGTGVGMTLVPRLLSKFFGTKAVASTTPTVANPAQPKPGIMSKFFGNSVVASPSPAVASTTPTVASPVQQKPGIMSKVSGAFSSAKTTVVEKAGELGKSAKGGVSSAARMVSDWAVNAKNGAIGAVSGGAKTVAEQAKSLAGASKSVATKFLGAPLMIAGAGYQAYDVASSDRSAEEKAKEYTKIAGGTGGMLIGAKVGAALGALTGPLAPIAVPVLGILGGALGYMGGEKTGEVGHDLVMGDQSNVIKEKLTQALGGTNPSAIQGVDYNSVMNYSPEIRAGEVIANSSKTERLDNLTKQIEMTNADNHSMSNQTTIVPVQINTPSAPQQSTQQEQKTFHIPATRNQDGTIQRLLDDNFTPMFR